ncbi:MAG: MATE family efflux transporter [Spirochaetes bacterium]|jgi:putative MATE family efflux protein|nr:MATE family efflux transporter [Spirochaetota bacterium]
MTINTERIELMKHEAVGKALFKLSAPAIAGMVAMAVYSLVDTFFVSLLRDTTAIAATGIVFPIFQLVGAIGLTFGMGAASVISRRLGENNYKAANETAATAFLTAAAAGILLAIGGIIFIKPLLYFFGATDSILDVATLYGRIIIGGAVFPVMNMCINNVLRSEGASLHSSSGQIAGAVANIILDPIFIFGLDMGITGAAVATVISQAISSLYLLSFYLRRKGVLHPLSLKYFKPDMHTYEQIMALGLPTFVRQILGSISFALVNGAAGSYGGDKAIAAISVTFRLMMLLMMALFGLGQGLQPLAGFNYGAKNFVRVRETIRLAFISAFVLCFTAGGIGFIFAPQIMEFFTPQDVTVIAMGTIAIRLTAATLIPVGIAIMFGGIFQSLGDGRSAMILAAGQQGVFLIPLILILPEYWGLTGVFAAQPFSFALAFLVGAFLYSRMVRKLHREEMALT